MTNKLIAYPEYPEKIVRDYFYSVSVTQGNKTISIPVYNEILQKNNFGAKLGDGKRRFCEFAFSGDPVRIDITVKADMQNYAVCPSRRRYKTSVNGNVVSITLPEPENFVFRINDSDETLLAIFADAPEQNVPSRDDENVIYIDTGFNDTDDGYLEVPEGKTLYIAPGAVLNAMVRVTGPNVTVKGRGMIRYPFVDRVGRQNNYLLLMLGEECQNTYIEDIKLCDSRGFSIVFWNSRKSHLKNVKSLCNQISTDGLSLWGNCVDIKVDHCFFHVTDNMFVYGAGDFTGFEVTNCLVGSDYAMFYPQSHTKGGYFKNIDIFRVGGIMKSSEGCPDNECYQTGSVFEDVYCTDVVRDPYFIWLWNGKSGLKQFKFKNLYLKNAKHPAFVDLRNGNDYDFSFENVWADGKPLNSFNGVFFNNNGENNKFEFVGECDEKHNATKTAVVNTAPYSFTKLYIGQYNLELENDIINENDTFYIPIITVLKQLKFKITYSNKTLTFWDNEKTTNVYVGNSYATVNGEDVKLSLPLISKDGVVYAPLCFFKECVGTHAVFEKENNAVCVTNINRGENLLINADLKDGLTHHWMTYNFAKIGITNDSHSGKNALFCQRIWGPNSSCAVSQWATDIFKQYGTGKYRLECFAKSDDSTGPLHVMFGVTKSGWAINDSTHKKIEITNIWQKLTYEFEVNDLNDFMEHHVFIGPRPGRLATLISDEWSLTKVSD